MNEEDVRDTENTIQALMPMYKRARRDKATQLCLAELERRLWELLKKARGAGITKGKDGERRDWFSTMFDGTVTEYDQRASILSLGLPYCTELFAVVDAKKISLNKAAEIARVTRQQAKVTGSRLSEVYAAVMKQTGGGVKPMPSNRPPRLKPASDREPDSARDFRVGMKELGAQFVEAALKGRDIDTTAKDRLVGEFNIGLGAVLDDMIDEVGKAKHGAKLQALSVVGRHKFTDACSVLGIHDEVFGKPIDLKRVLKRHKRRSYELHADRNGSVNPDREREYREVQDARTVLEYYARQMGVKEGTNARKKKGKR